MLDEVKHLRSKALDVLNALWLIFRGKEGANTLRKSKCLVLLIRLTEESVHALAT